MEVTTKGLARALRIVVALDERVRTGRMDERADAALKDAEATICAVSGRALLEAFREWNANGVPGTDPTGGPAPRDTNEYKHTAMRARRS